MITVLKSIWHNKRVIVSIDECYKLDGFGRSFRMCIKVVDCHWLPISFARGKIHTANQDIIETLGGFSHYIAYILELNAQKEQARREKVLSEQFTLF